MAFGEITSSKPDLGEPTKVGELRQAHAAPGRAPRERAGPRPSQILLSTLRTIGQFWGQSGWAAWRWGHSWTPRWTINCQSRSERSAWRHRPLGFWRPVSLRRGHTLVPSLVPTPHPRQKDQEKVPPLIPKLPKRPLLCAIKWEPHICFTHSAGRLTRKHILILLSKQALPLGVLFTQR